MFFNDSKDPFTISYIAFTAGLAQANNDFAGYGQGAAGYAKRFGAGMADESTSGFFSQNGMTGCDSRCVDYAANR